MNLELYFTYSNPCIPLWYWPLSTTSSWNGEMCTNRSLHRERYDYHLWCTKADTIQSLLSSMEMLPLILLNYACVTADSFTAETNTKPVLGRSWRLVCQGLISEHEGCAVHTAEQPGSAFSVLQCLCGSKSPCAICLTIFYANFRTDQVFTNFPPSAWWWHLGTYSYRFDIDHLYLIHAWIYFLCYR